MDSNERSDGRNDFRGESVALADRLKRFRGGSAGNL